MSFKWIEEQPALQYGPGHLDLVFSILKTRNHPIVLVEEAAFRWMGLSVSPVEVRIISPSARTLRCLH